MTKTNCLSWLVFCWIIDASSPLLAHDGEHGHDHQPSRIWQLSDGTTITGTFIDSGEDQLRLLTDAGAVESIEVWRLAGKDRLWLAQRSHDIHQVNTSSRIKLVGTTRQPDDQSDWRPAMADAFKAFEDSVKVRWDQQHLFVESNGIPDHPLMIGIRSWQQQVPLPQAYVGDNAWRIPLNPVPAKNPVSTKGKFLRGAIAIAVNGIPIFNPLNNRGDDAYLYGELDQYGGHCGRADDYHYHLAPVHLEKLVGKGQPIAYALDGYPILGYQDPQAPDYAPLDGLGGHKDDQGNYHYHATEKYPYVNGGFYGQVVERDGQVDPQPRAEPLRPALQPLRDAKITNFEKHGQITVLTYEIKGRPGTVRYTENDDGRVDFVFTDPTGKATSQSYRKRGSPIDRPKRDAPPASPERPAPRGEKPRSTDSSRRTNDNTRESLVVTSQSVGANGFINIDCTCDGKKQSPAVAWKDVPEGTKSLAISIWHTAPDQEKSYWLVYNIPADTKELPLKASGIGTVGINDRRRSEYEPMCSKGPGVKVYHITVYAFSRTLDVAASQCSRKRLLDEVEKYCIGQGTLDFKYER